jgi:hypothetical protein
MAREMELGTIWQAPIPFCRKLPHHTSRDTLTGALPLLSRTDSPLGTPLHTLLHWICVGWY